MISSDQYKITFNYEIQSSAIKYTVKKLNKINRFLVKRNSLDYSYIVSLNKVDKPYNNKYKVTLDITSNGAASTYSSYAMNIMAAVDIIEEKVLIS